MILHMAQKMLLLCKVCNGICKMSTSYLLLVVSMCEVWLPAPLHY